jgi:soluble lytic murein transglycosylase-like protein
LKLSILVALAILPCLALSAQAHSSRGHHHGARFGHHARGHHFRTYRHHRHRFRADAIGTPDGMPHDHSASVPEGRAAIYAMVTRSAIEHGLPPALAHGIVRVESGYNCAAYNRGAAGIMQVKAATARSVGVSGGLRSCSEGLEAGMRYLREAYQLAHGNPAFAATLYNRGLGARPSQSGYSRSVMRMSSL